MARPSKYESHVQPKLLLIEAWARDGLTLEQIAENCGVALSSLCEYKNQYSELSEALKNGRDVIDIMVENALLKSALGYQYTETTHEAVKFGDEQTDAKLVKTVVKEVSPNTTALIFWLKNRKSKEWRDKQDIDMNATIEYALKLPPKPGE